MKTPKRLPHTVWKNNRLYVRKALIVGGKQKQIWRTCEPPTAKRVNEILLEIEAGILAESDKSNFELAKIFLKVWNKEITFDEFKQKAKTI